MSLDLSFYGRLFENGRDALIAVDAQCVVVHWNDRIELLSGINRREALGIPLSELFPALEESGAAHVIQSALEGNSTAASPPYFAVSDRREAFQYEWFVAPLLGQGKVQGLVLVARSVVERGSAKVASESRLPPGPTVRAAEPQHDLERLLYATSHDLREPTRMISNYVELLIGQLGTSLDPTLTNYMRVVEQSAERVRATVDDLLNFAKVRSADLEMKEVDLERVFTSLVDELSPIIAETQALVTWEGVGRVHGDAALLRSLFGNLLRNSLRFHGAAPPRVHAAGLTRGDEQVVCVLDHGIGFKQEHAERAFEMFQRLHPRHEYRGTGIGLALAREITTRHGGRIWAEAKPDQGARFYVALPRRARGV